MSALIICTTEEDVPALYLLVCFDPVRGGATVVALPPETAVQNGKIESLGEVYRFGGARYTTTALAESLGIPIDRYMRMNTETLARCADWIGPVELDLPREVTLQRNGTTAVLAAGKQLLGGANLIGAVTEYDGDRLERYDLAARIAAAFINQRRDVALGVNADNIFKNIVNAVDTDITAADYEQRKPALEYFAGLTGDSAFALQLTGSYNEDGLFVLSDTFLALLAQTFGAGSPPG